MIKFFNCLENVLSSQIYVLPKHFKMACFVGCQVSGKGGLENAPTLLGTLERLMFLYTACPGKNATKV